MKLVAGLGNPGPEYRGTRHNVGFAVLDALRARHGLSSEAQLSRSGNALECRWRRPGDDVLLLHPLTFMNLSGQAVGDVMRFYKIDVGSVFIVCDDVNLPLGRLRARASGSEGGHNGLKSVADHLGTIDYARLRVGVGRGDDRRDLADHVLARFDAAERPVIDEAIGRAADAVEMWLSGGLTKVMNTFNRADEKSDGAAGP